MRSSSKPIIYFVTFADIYEPNVMDGGSKSPLLLALPWSYSKAQQALVQ